MSIPITHPEPRTLQCDCVEATYVVVRRARPDDLTETALMHTEHLPLGLFPGLGARFLARWHSAFVESPYGTALVAVHVSWGEQRVVGVLFGSTDHAAFRRHLLDWRQWRLVRDGLLALIRRPAERRLFVRTRLGHYVRRVAATMFSRRTEGSPAERVSVLSAIVVDPELRRRGLATHLVEHFERDCRAASARRIELVAPDTAEAMTFYTSTGWSMTEQCVNRDGARVGLYSRDIERSNGDH